MRADELSKHFAQARLGELFYFIGDAKIRLVEFDHTSQVNGSGDQYQIARSVADAFFQFCLLYTSRCV